LGGSPNPLENPYYPDWEPHGSLPLQKGSWRPTSKKKRVMGLKNGKEFYPNTKELKLEYPNKFREFLERKPPKFFPLT